MRDAFGHDVRLAVDAVWRVLLISVVIGAGLPALFALAIRSLAVRPGGGRLVLGRVAAVVLLLVIAYAVVGGLLYIVASGQGNDVSFAHVIPQITAKKS